MSLRGALARIGFRWRLAAAVACLLLAGVTALEGHAAPAATRAGRPAVVAARSLPAGRVLTSSDLAVVRERDRWPGVVPRPALVTGRTLAGPLLRGEPVTASRLVDRALTRGLPPGLVAMPVDIATDVRGLVRAGTRVDLFSVPGPDEPDAGASSARRLADRVLVLSALPPEQELQGCRLVLAIARGDAPHIAAARSAGLLHVAALSP